MKSMMKKTISELMRLNTYEERLEYLYIGDKVGNETFGNARWINQKLYKSQRWRNLRDKIILRDSGCDLGIDGCELTSRNILIHHINPITEDDIINFRYCVFDPENLISASLDSHNYIHYGTKIQSLPVERHQFDTCPWKR